MLRLARLHLGILETGKRPKPENNDVVVRVAYDYLRLVWAVATLRARMAANSLEPA